MPLLDGLAPLKSQLREYLATCPLHAAALFSKDTLRLTISLQLLESVVAGSAYRTVGGDAHDYRNAGYERGQK